MTLEETCITSSGNANQQHAAWENETPEQQQIPRTDNANQQHVTCQ